MYENNPKILRTVFITPEMDSILRTRAFHLKITRDELVSKYLDFGIKSDKLACKQERDKNFK